MSNQSPELQDLLEKYADTCDALSRLRARMFGAHGWESNSVEKRKSNLESQIIKLFEEARSEGARVERAEMSFEDAMKFVSAWLWNNGEAEMWPASNMRDTARIVQAFANKDIDKQSLAQAEEETK